MLQNMIIYLVALQTIQFIALMHFFNRVIGKPVAKKLVIYIDGKKGVPMQILNADKTYKIEVRGEDNDGNAVEIDPSAAPSFSLSAPEMGEITQAEDGSFELNPNKVGLVTLQAQSGELFGTLDCEIKAGALSKITVSVSEKA